MVGDADRLDFYVSRLGFKIDFSSGTYFAALSRGGLQLLLSPVKGPGAPRSPCRTANGPPRAAGPASSSTHPISRARWKGFAAGVHFRNDIVVGLAEGDPVDDLLGQFTSCSNRADRAAGGVRVSRRASWVAFWDGMDIAIPLK